MSKQTTTHPPTTCQKLGGGRHGGGRQEGKVGRVGREWKGRVGREMVGKGRVCSTVCSIPTLPPTLPCPHLFRPTHPPVPRSHSHTGYRHTHWPTPHRSAQPLPSPARPSLPSPPPSQVSCREGREVGGGGRREERGWMPCQPGHHAMRDRCLPHCHPPTVRPKVSLPPTTHPSSPHPQGSVGAPVCGEAAGKNKKHAQPVQTVHLFLGKNKMQIKQTPPPPPPPMQWKDQKDHLKWREHP